MQNLRRTCDVLLSLACENPGIFTPGGSLRAKHKFGHSHAREEHRHFKRLRNRGTARLSVDVSNTGARAGDEVPQLYVHSQVASGTRPVMQLPGFQQSICCLAEKDR